MDQRRRQRPVQRRHSVRMRRHIERRTTHGIGAGTTVAKSRASGSARTTPPIPSHPDGPQTTGSGAVQCVPLDPGQSAREWPTGWRAFFVCLWSGLRTLSLVLARISANGRERKWAHWPPRSPSSSWFKQLLLFSVDALRGAVDPSVTHCRSAHISAASPFVFAILLEIDGDSNESACCLRKKYMERNSEWETKQLIDRSEKKEKKGLIARCVNIFLRSFWANTTNQLVFFFAIFALFPSIPLSLCAANFFIPNSILAKESKSTFRRRLAMPFHTRHSKFILFKNAI